MKYYLFFFILLFSCNNEIKENKILEFQKELISNQTTGSNVVLIHKQGEIVYGEARPGEVKRFISNSDKMKSFGWSPKVDLEEGLEKYINWRKSL